MFLTLVMCNMFLLKRVTSAVDMETMLRLLMHATNVITTSVANYIYIFSN